MNQIPEQTTEAAEEFAQFLVKQIAQHPEAGRYVLNLQKSIFDAAEASGVNPVLALSFIFMDALQAHICEMKMECTKKSLGLGKIPEYIVEGLKELERKTTEE